MHIDYIYREKLSTVYMSCLVFDGEEWIGWEDGKGKQECKDA